MADHPTQVLSLDELMDLAAEPRDDTATQQITTPPAAPPAAPAVTPAPAPLNPAARQPIARPVAPAAAAPAAAGPDLRQRVMTDARQAYDAGLARGREWIKQGDNGLIAATLVAALLLLLVVAVG